MAELDRLLDDDVLFQQVKADMSRLLVDGVRVLDRTLTKARQLLGERAEHGRTLFRNRLRSAKQLLQQVLTATRQRAQAEQMVATSPCAC